MTDDAGRNALAERLDARLNKDRRGNYDKEMGLRVGPGMYEDIAAAVAALRTPLPATASREAIANIKTPLDLKALLATMKSAKEKGVGMSIWDRDITAVEDAIDTILALAPVQSATREAKAATLARRLCQLFDNGGESQRTVRARHASAIFQLLRGSEIEQEKCDSDPVNYLQECEALSSVPADERGEVIRNWTEDASHENGNYECRCVECGNSFIGHKRRVLCKVCSNLCQPVAWRVRRDDKHPWAYSHRNEAPVGYELQPLYATPTQPSDRDAVVEGWQPIETAPKDGQHVLIAAKSGLIDIAHWSHGCWGGFIGPNEATHWRPIPAPPSLTPPERKP